MLDPAAGKEAAKHVIGRWRFLFSQITYLVDDGAIDDRAFSLLLPVHRVSPVDVMPLSCKQPSNAFQRQSVPLIQAFFPKMCQLYAEGEAHSVGRVLRRLPIVFPIAGPNDTRRHSMQNEQIREIVAAHWRASAAGDLDAEHDIYDDGAICDYPQSGERILGRSNLQALRGHHPDKPSGFDVKRIQGEGNLWITEYMITYQGRATYTVSIMEFCNGKVVHETQYFSDPFKAPTWRSRWVQQVS